MPIRVSCSRSAEPVAELAGIDLDAPLDHQGVLRTVFEPGRLDLQWKLWRTAEVRHVFLQGGVGRRASRASAQPRRGRSRDILDSMSTPDAANEWDLTVPGDDAELVAEFRRHGVQPGQRVHVALVVGGDESNQEAGEALPSFFGSFAGPADLAERSSEILRVEFPHGR